MIIEVFVVLGRVFVSQECPCPEDERNIDVDA